MASIASSTSLSLISTTFSPASLTRSSFNAPFSLPATCILRSSTRYLGFVGAAADPLFTIHVAFKLQSLKTSGKTLRDVASMAKKSVEDLTAAELKGKKVFVMTHLNVSLNDSQVITDDTRIRVVVPTIKYLIENSFQSLVRRRTSAVTKLDTLQNYIPVMDSVAGQHIDQEWGSKRENVVVVEMEKMYTLEWSVNF